MVIVRGIAPMKGQPQEVCLRLYEDGTSIYLQVTNAAGSPELSGNILSVTKATGEITRCQFFNAALGFPMDGSKGRVLIK